MIKNIVSIVLAISVIAVVVILSGAVFFNQDKPGQELAGKADADQNVKPADLITLNLVGQHNKSSDCWMIISDKVYNVTDYIPLHPAGPESIILFCGKDGTEAFNTKGGKGPHSQSAKDLLVNYYVGDLNKNIEQQNNMQQQTNFEIQGIKIEVLKQGTGAEAKSGNNVSVHYTGTLINGTKFDSSVDRGQPFEFSLGAGQVIKGWDLGVAGMKVGEKRKLTIPADLAYGNRAVGSIIPANSTLVFEIDMLKIN